MTFRKLKLLSNPYGRTNRSVHAYDHSSLLFPKTPIFVAVRKFISSILAILVLVLSCLPCSDVDALPLSDNTATAISAAPLQDCSGHHAACDLCSPFCACFCCAATALPIAHNMALQPFLPIAQCAFAAYLPTQLAEVFIPIWQPPQLV